jgi:replicative DNA helicase
MTEKSEKRTTSERNPPCSLEAERGIIGAALLEYATVVPSAIGKYAITSDSFYTPANRAIWSAIESLNKKNRPIDILTVTDELRQSGDIESVGGQIELTRIVDATPPAAHSE